MGKAFYYQGLPSNVDDTSERTVRAQEIVRALTRPGDAAGEPEYKLRGRTVKGKLDLRNRTVEVAVDIRDCDFLDEVDLSYCDFKQAVNLSRCTFHKSFKSGGELEAHTTYRKDLVCNGAIFEGDANFTGARVEGDVHLSEDASQDPHRVAVFRGAVSFRAFRCDGYGFFEGVRFASRETTDFRRASFGAQLDFNNTIFVGPVKFNALKCDSAAYFRNAQFLSTETADDLDKVTSASERYAVSFRHASFERHLVFKDAVFRGPVSFNSIKCGSTGFFEGTRFETGKQNFRYASFQGNWRFDDSTFNGQESDFRYVSVGGSLSFKRVYFDTDVRLGHVRISEKLSLIGSCFKNEAGLYGATIKILELLDANHHDEVLQIRDPGNANARLPAGGDEPQSGPYAGWAPRFLAEWWRKRRRRSGVGDLAEKLFPFKRCSPNLTGTTFERFHGGRDERLERELALRLVNKQEPAKFSRDPYMQLERFYRSTGNETKARNIYRCGRRDYSRIARKPDSSITWSLPRNVTDLLWWIMTGYGVVVWRLLGFAVLMVLVGMLLFYFWPNEALDPASSSAKDNSGEEKMSYLTLYSLDLFLPLVNLHVDEKWTPAALGLQIYAVAHAMIGWLVVPLLVAALAGIMRR